MKHSVLASAAIFALIASPAALAQTTGTVFGPSVNAGDRAVEYRLGVEWNESGDAPDLAHRFHIQHSFTDALRWRLIASWSDRTGRDLEFDHVQGELLWQIIETTPRGYASALRFEARISGGDDTPHEIGVNWTHQWRLNEDWRLRALVLVDRDVGPDAEDDWIVETRASLSRRLGQDYRITLESFNEFGGVNAGFGAFDDQSHQLGPVLSGSFSPTVDWSAGVLFGLSEASPDQDLVLRLTRPF